MSNYLLEKVGYAPRNPSQFNSEVTKSTLTVKSTFAYDPDSKTAPDTAKRWAQDHKNKTLIKPFVKNNDPFTIQIISLESRMEGGRAYKVIDDQGHMFDLREDQVVEALALGGIQPGGKVNGEFVWGKNHSQMKLVYVGGQVHKEMLAGLKARQAVGTNKSGKLKATYVPSKLIPGHIYSRIGVQQEFVYLYIGKFRLPPEIVKETCYAITKENVWDLSKKTNEYIVKKVEDTNKTTKKSYFDGVAFKNVNYTFDITKSVSSFHTDHGSISAELVKNIRLGMPVSGWSTLKENIEDYYNKYVQAKPAWKQIDHKHTYYGWNSFDLAAQQKEYAQANKIHKENQENMTKWLNDFDTWFKHQIEWSD